MGPSLKERGTELEGAAAWDAINAFTADQVSVAPFRMLENVPSNLLQQWADAFAFVTDEVKAAMEGDEGADLDAALKWRLILPQLLLRTAPRNVDQPKNYVSRRFHMFVERDWFGLLKWWAGDVDAARALLARRLGKFCVWPRARLLLAHMLEPDPAARATAAELLSDISGIGAVIYDVVSVLAGGGKGGIKVMSGGKPAGQNGGK